MSVAHFVTVRMGLLIFLAGALLGSLLLGPLLAQDPFTTYEQPPLPSQPPGAGPQVCNCVCPACPVSTPAPQPAQMPGQAAPSPVPFPGVTEVAPGVSIMQFPAPPPSRRPPS